MIMSNESFALKLKTARTEKGFTQHTLAKMLNVSFGTVGNWEAGTRKPDSDMLRRIADTLEVSVDYLIGRDVTHAHNIKNIIPLKTKKVPLLGDIACGKPIFADEQFGEFVSVSDDIDCDFCLRAVGDSMTGARINDGDIVFIREQPSVDNGQIAAVIIDDEATLKRVYFYPDKQKLVLNPENPAFEPLVYVGEELEQIHILGKAVAFQSLVR